MEFRDKKLEEKIANIKVALKELGASLEFEDKYENPQRTMSDFMKDTPDPSFSYKPAPNDKLDLKMLYNYEKERNSTLEARILHKDELLTEMTILQNELYANIEELQNTAASLQSDLDYSQNKIQQLVSDLEGYSEVLKAKDAEILYLSQEKEKYFTYLMEKDEESKLLNEELNTKEPDKRLMFALEKRNQELLLEIDDLQHHLQEINTNQFQVLNLQEKLRVSEMEMDSIVKHHSTEVAAYMQKINNMELQLMRLSTENVQNKIEAAQEQSLHKYKQNYCELLKILELNESQHSQAVQKMQEIISKTEENYKLDHIKDNLCYELGVEADQIVNRVKGIQEDVKLEHKLYERLADLMTQCAPAGKFEGLPTCRQVWKWITRILEDYMTIKKELVARH